MNRTLPLIIAALVLIGIAWIWREHGSSTLPSPPVTSEASPSASGVPGTAPTVVVSDTAGASVSVPVASGSPAATVRPLKDAMPNANDYRTEVEADPHNIPKSVTEFAVVMGQRMEAAMANEDAARKLFPELRDCVAQAQVPSVQKTCLVNSRRLKQRHPSLAQEAAAVEGAASSELKESVKNLGF